MHVWCVLFLLALLFCLSPLPELILIPWALLHCHLLGDFLEAKDMVTPSDVEETIIRREEVQQLLSTLNDREREIIALRYGLTGDAPQTLEELGLHFQITRERVRQIELRALKKLRKLGTDILN